MFWVSDQQAAPVLAPEDGVEPARRITIDKALRRCFLHSPAPGYPGIDPGRFQRFGKAV